MSVGNRDPGLEQTRERILDEAERLFAELGFAAVSVRQITQAAQTNIAAVNYHFGGKDNLYLEVFRQRWLPRARRLTAQLEALESRGVDSLEEVVRTIAEAMLLGFTGQEERVQHSLLIMREVAKPSAAFDVVVQDALGPFLALMGRMLAKGLPGLDEQGLKLYCLSVFFQVLHFNFARNLVSRATGRDYDQAFLARLVEHITSFALRGLAGAGPLERKS